VGDTPEKRTQIAGKLAEVYTRLGRAGEALAFLEKTVDSLVGNVGAAELPLLCRLADLQVRDFRLLHFLIPPQRWGSGGANRIWSGEIPANPKVCVLV